MRSAADRALAAVNNKEGANPAVRASLFVFSDPQDRVRVRENPYYSNHPEHDCSDESK
jgi:hypothetical protein